MTIKLFSGGHKSLVRSFDAPAVCWQVVICYPGLFVFISAGIGRLDSDYYGPGPIYNTVQRQKAVTAYFLSEQSPFFVYFDGNIDALWYVSHDVQAWYVGLLYGVTL